MTDMTYLSFNSFPIYKAVFAKIYIILQAGKYFCIETDFQKNWKQP